jgi:hypothetical protein
MANRNGVSIAYAECPGRRRDLGSLASLWESPRARQILTQFLEKCHVHKYIFCSHHYMEHHDPARLCLLSFSWLPATPRSSPAGIVQTPTIRSSILGHPGSLERRAGARLTRGGHGEIAIMTALSALISFRLSERGTDVISANLG